MPAADDPATLTSAQVAAALADEEPFSDIKVRFTPKPLQDRAWLLEVENDGTANAVGTLRVDVAVEAGTIEWIDPRSGASAQPMCHTRSDANPPEFERCSERRANMIRIEAPGLRAGQTLTTALVLTTKPPEVLSFSVETQTDAGDRYVDRAPVVPQDGVKQ
jgi:hypothetical protein